MSRASKHMGRVAELGCILCRSLDYGQTPAEVHHIGATSDRNPYLTIPLCPEHHRGATGFHGLGQRAFERTYRESELSLLAKTIEALHG